ncbi:MAG TPA: response regulator transcription factor [Anaerolineae bacterium]|nr:response regulator transcription factor [Anaerolineae bacterium]
MHLSSKRILVVDDDPDTCDLIVDVLTKEGYVVYSYQNGEQARNALAQGWFDLVLADIKMPRVSGIQLLMHIKESRLDTKVILMTAYASLETAIQAVRGGAFDYLVKPFALDDLRQRVREALPDEVDPEQMLRYRDLYLDLDARRVLIGECEVALTRQEFEVVACLFEQPGCTVAWEELLRRIWGIQEPTKKNLGVLRSCIRRLRRKLGDDANRPRYIINKWGEGYQLGQRSL